MRAFQYVVPMAKHWKPETVAKRTGVLDRSMPLTVPRMRPNAPMKRSGDVCKDGL